MFIFLDADGVIQVELMPSAIADAYCSSCDSCMRLLAERLVDICCEM